MPLMPSLRFNPNDNIIVVEAKLWGNLATTARMVFDTGASLVMLPWKIATGIGLDIDPKNLVQTTTASGVESSPKIIVPKISILGETVEKVEALVKDLPAEAGVDGLLGLSFIKHFNLKIDFRIGKLSLERF